MRIWPTRRAWKRGGITLLTLVAILLIANGFMAWWTELRLQKKIATIRAAGYPASLAELAPEPIPDSENAAAILKNMGPRLDAFSHDYARFDDTPVGLAYGERLDRGDAPTPEQIEAIRAILDKYPDLAAGLATAAACEKYASMSDFSLNSGPFIAELIKDPIGRFRTAERFQEWRMEVLVSEGKQEKAVELGIEFLRVARLHDQEPLLVNALVGIAVRGIMFNGIYDALAGGPISPKLRGELDRELALHDDPKRISQVMITERAYGATAMTEFGWGPSTDRPHPILMHTFGWVMQRQALNVLDSYDAMLNLMGQPSPKTNREICTVGARAVEKYGALAKLAIPATQAWYEAQMRCIAMTRALRIYNALTAFAEKNKREAKGLEELGLARETTIDPFDGKPLKLKHAKEGWIVYTVFKNGVDDGGTFIGMQDFGLAPPQLRMTEAPKDAAAKQ
jgi:hypothetical protein